MNQLLLDGALLCLFIAVGCPSVGAINLEVREGRAIVDGVYLNGHGPYRFLIDTGATLNHVDSALAESIGLTTKFQSQVRTSTGSVDGPGTNGVEVSLGDVHAENQNFLFTGMAAVRHLSSGIQGVLGQGFLSRFDYQIDLVRHRLNFGTLASDPAGTLAMFRFSNSRMVVSTSLGWLVLDSGAHMLTRFGMTATNPTLQMITMSGTQSLGSVPSKLVINGRTLWRGDAVAVPQTMEPDVQGLLPTGLFKAIYVCNSRGYIILE